MRFYGITDVGRERSINEDYISLPETSESLKIFILADGMGGANAGEIASVEAVKASKKYIEENINKILIADPDEVRQLILNAVLEANKRVIELSNTVKEYKGMGTTLIVLYVLKNKVFIGHVGDSRVYRIRKNIIRQLTKDHSFVQELVNTGTITKQEAKNHPQKNILTKVIGYEQDIKPDIITKGFLKDDVILICSDGLTNMLEDSQIYEIITNNILDNQKMSKELVDRANESGGLDNISVITISND